jgi:DNA replication terminus site-binding protein (Ter protein)
MLIDFAPQFVSYFTTLLQALDTCNAHIQSNLSELPLWVDNGANEFVKNRGKVIFALGNFVPTQGLSPQETFKCPGVVASTLQTLKLIDEVNQAKSAFKQLVRTCQQTMQLDMTKFVRTTLAHAGYPGIKLKQVFRHIIYIDYHPRRIAWTKGKHTTSKQLSKQASEKLLDKAGQGLHIEIQKAKLNSLHHQTKLIKHRAIKPGWVVNIGAFKENNCSAYEDIRTALPLFYLHDQQLPNPIVCFAKPRLQTRKMRADKQIESVAFLPSISVYRYKKEVLN